MATGSNVIKISGFITVIAAVVLVMLLFLDTTEVLAGLGPLVTRPVGGILLLVVLAGVIGMVVGVVRLVVEQVNGKGKRR